MTKAEQDAKLDEFFRANLPLVRTMVFCFVRSLVVDGELDLLEESDDELVARAMSELERTNKTRRVEMITDFTGDLLRRARELRRSRDGENSAMFYTLWFEHQINRTILSFARRRKLEADVAEQLVRRTALRDKTGWVLRLLGHPAFPKKQCTRIGIVEELRNSYVHYKWKAEPEDHRQRVCRALDGAESAVKYVRLYQNKHIFRGQLRRLMRLFGGYRMSRNQEKLVNVMIDIDRSSLSEEKKAELLSQFSLTADSDG